MPELPEVETTRRGIEAALVNNRVKDLVVRDRRLRWVVPEGIEQRVAGQKITAVERRAKYLLIKLGNGYLIWHLGMTGSMCIVTEQALFNKHDHIDLVLQNGSLLRFTDPRRFGCLLWADKNVLAHPLLISLGPEPLDDEFNGAYLYQRSRGRKVAVKNFIMNQKVVVGVGNIYASEALFLSGISPARQAKRISMARYQLLAEQIKRVLCDAIQQGGTTLNNFLQVNGQPGYFKQKLLVYGREGAPCEVCTAPIMKRVIGQRSSYYCPVCQR